MSFNTTTIKTGFQISDHLDPSASDGKWVLNDSFKLNMVLLIDIRLSVEVAKYSTVLYRTFPESEKYDGNTKRSSV